VPEASQKKIQELLVRYQNYAGSNNISGISKKRQNVKEIFF
jgi:hypothetical protein